MQLVEKTGLTSENILAFKKIAGEIHETAKKLSTSAEALGYKQKNKIYFDTLIFDAYKIFKRAWRLKEPLIAGTALTA